MECHTHTHTHTHTYTHSKQIDEVGSEFYVTLTRLPINKNGIMRRAPVMMRVSTLAGLFYSFSVC